MTGTNLFAEAMILTPRHWDWLLTLPDSAGFRNDGHSIFCRVSILQRVRRAPQVGTSARSGLRNLLRQRDINYR